MRITNTSTHLRDGRAPSNKGCLINAHLVGVLEIGSQPVGNCGRAQPAATSLDSSTVRQTWSVS